ncbi:cell wall hydrolase [Starkeya sp. 3C]|uniref:Cell wall hydrolase n=1 Tax=Ancylobacter moscoviensis TaxID=2597768 RepID=A0ABY3DWJ4_9HYPH|nr:cell wall hydrolase [Ancylobacter moscoviensis]TSJ64550.1 cell wall hydrolase [Ancylobacter moscoviensis]
MQISTRVRSWGTKGGLLLLLLAGGSTSIGFQDILGRMARQPDVTERARISILGGPLHTLKASTFAWPSASALLSGSAIPTPPAASLAIDINRDTKADRLALDADERLEADPLAGAGDPTPASLAGSGTASPATGATGTATTGAGTGATDVFAGAGSDPYEDADDEAGADIAAIEAHGLYSVPAGDPTGDPTQLEDNGPAIGLGAGETDISVPGDGALAALGEDGEPAGRSSYKLDPALPLYRQNVFIFGLDQAALPPQPFLHRAPGERAPLPGESGTTTAAKSDAEPGDEDAPRLARGPSPADRLGLSGKRRDRAEKCLAEAVYFESRGEPKRGQVAVAQVVMNRVFSGYYPSDICRAVYQNANRRFACQFTFACDNIRDVVTEPSLWKQAQEIAADMLDGLVWDEKVGRATHYHARSVRPNWIREMRKLDRIGEHTFYRPRRWTS